jgi:hypothetical protein
MYFARRIAMVVVVAAAIYGFSLFVWQRRARIGISVVRSFAGNYIKDFDGMIADLKDPGQSEALWSACNELMVAQPQQEYYQLSDPKVGDPIRRLKPTHVFVSTNRCCLFFDREFRRGIIADSRDEGHAPDLNCIPIRKCLWYYDSVKNPWIPAQ